jgi:hypothetical protein
VVEPAAGAANDAIDLVDGLPGGGTSTAGATAAVDAATGGILP